MPQIPTSDIDAAKRRLITPTNLAELGITDEVVASVLELDGLKFDFLRDGKFVSVYPEGLSINETTFGTYSGPTAADRGWNAYMSVGAPLVEERSDIIQPPADVLSARAYENRSAASVRSFEDSIEFTIANTFRWHLEGEVDLTLHDEVSSEESSALEQSVEKSLAQLMSSTFIAHNHKDNVGSQVDTKVQVEVTDTAGAKTTGTSTGSRTLATDILLRMMGFVEGEITTSWTSRSSVSGDIGPGTRVETLATQRRQIQQYVYELPITFGGFVALQYPEPVPVQQKPPQSTPPDTATVIAQDILSLNLVPAEGYRPKGVAETVSSLDVDHVVFADEAIGNRAQSFARPRQHYA